MIPVMRFDRPPPEPLASAPGSLLSWNGLLTLIATEPGSTQQELVDRSMIDPSSMVAVIDELEELGLAERRPHPGDRRKHDVHLTAKGTKTLERARTAAMRTAKELLSPLDAEERE